MRLKGTGLILIVALAGCVSTDPTQQPAPNPMGCTGSCGRSAGPPVVKSLQDPNGNPVPMMAPYASNPPPNQWIERNLLAHGSIPLDKVQFNNPNSLNLAMMQAGSKGGFTAPPTPVPPG